MEKSIPEFETDLHRALNALKEQGLNLLSLRLSERMVSCSP